MRLANALAICYNISMNKNSNIKLTRPSVQLKRIYNRDEAIKEAQKIIRRGGFAWIEADNSPEMGHPSFWGYMVCYFSPARVRKAAGI